MVTLTISRTHSSASSVGSAFHADWNTEMKRLPERWSGAARHASIARRITIKRRSSSRRHRIKDDTRPKGNEEGSS
ncbi:MAG: hypothetical protein QOJ99_2501 [Bryobacterales bacterium]|nr:hypothetical protein [Bryobacterales bacterium]